MRPPALTHPSAAVFLGDCLDVLAEMPDDSVDAIVTDPPYGLGFMGQKWDTYANETGRAASSKDHKFDHVGGNHNPSNSADASRTRRVEAQRFGEWCSLWTVEALRVLKPGGHLLAFGGTRTWHRLAVAVEDAGFEVRDSIAWLYGSGFPKSLDVSKAIDKLDASAERRARALEFTAFIRESGLSASDIDSLTATNMGGHYTTAASQPTVATADLFDLLRPHLPEVPERIEELVRQRTVESENFKSREIVGIDRRMNEPSGIVGVGQGERTEIERKITNAHTPAAQQWAGWGTALKPAFEPIVVARKPLVGTVAANVLAWETGALNIDGTRVGSSGGTAKGTFPKGESSGIYGDGINGACEIVDLGKGRWPANVLLDGDAAAELDGQSGTTRSPSSPVTQGRRREGSGWDRPVNEHHDGQGVGYGDAGGASRFFPVFPREFDCCENGEHGPLSQAPPALPTFRYQAKAPTRERPTVVAEDGTKTAHPTVKPLALMRWLVRLVTPPGGTVLDTFAGSGATIEAAVEEGFFAFGIEREESYLPLIQVRLDRVGVPEEPAA